MGKWGLLGLSPQTWRLKPALAIESDSGRDGDIRSHHALAWHFPGLCLKSSEHIVLGEGRSGVGSWQRWDLEDL